METIHPTIRWKGSHLSKKILYSFKLSIGGIQFYQLSNEIESPINPIYHNVDSLKIGAFICESQNFSEFAIADQRKYRRQDSFC